MSRTAWHAAKALLLAPYLVVAVVGVAAMALFAWTRPRALVGIFFAYYVAIHVVAYGAHRFHLPLVPILLIWSLALAARDTPIEPGPARRVAASLLLLLMVACLLPGLRAGQPAAH